jgi:tRNA threonylcarbamoyladenosine biosynthesis protein TsaE
VRDVIEILSRRPRQTRNVGRVLGEILHGGEIIELCGPLGAGKTQLAKGLAVGLGVSEDEVVVSPTFVLVRQYVGRLTFCHCDAYRLQTAEELLALGLEELLDGGQAVVAIEWAERFPGVLAAETFRVDLEHAGRTTRRIRISTPSPASAAQLARRLEKASGGSGCQRPAVGNDPSAAQLG